MRRSSLLRAMQLLVISTAVFTLPPAALAQTTTSTTGATSTSTSAVTTTTASTTTTTTIHVDPACAFQGGCLDHPPVAFVTGTGGDQRGVTLGTCWTLPPSGGQPGASVCTSVVLVPPSALVVEKGTDLTLRFDPTLPASEITVVRRSSSDAPFDQPIIEQLSLPAGSGGSFGAGFPEGTWDLVVTARFAQGSVPYFFRVRVVTSSGGPDAPSTRIAFTG